MKTKLLALALALSFAMPLSVSATSIDEGSTLGAEIRAEIEELKAYRQELSDKVDNGEMTEEQAHEAFKAALDELKALKEAYFEEKIAAAKAKYETLAENNPELAEAIQTRWEGFREARETRKAECQALRESLASGEITREEFKTGLSEARMGFKNKRMEHKNEFRGFIKNRNAERDDHRGRGWDDKKDEDDESDDDDDDDDDGEE